MGYTARDCNDAWRKKTLFHVALFPVRDSRQTSWLAGLGFGEPIFHTSGDAMPKTLQLKSIPASAKTNRARNTDRPVMLIGFQNQGNLGIGYLASTLIQQGYAVRTFDFEKDPEELLQAEKAQAPILIGFSLIFQFYIRRFAAVIRYLREHGVGCHITMGGHFPSLSYRETFAEIPELDSVVLFEGEETLVELVDCLSTGQTWRDIHGIAYMAADTVQANPLRALIEDLDTLPYPQRDYEPPKVLGRVIMPLLASRGCIRRCSFCSIHTFYRTAPGKVVRTRQPSEVVREMRALHEQRGVTVFLFQDDDFPLFGKVWRRWALEFVDALWRNALVGRVIWKINCRADVVETELFSRMQAAGLYLVYMGLESGSDEGLETLNKGITAAQNLRAVEILKSIGLMFEYGFMLFDPSSSFQSVRSNLAFLRSIVGDGSTAATFCRMLPYDGTPIKTELARTGRLRGDVCNPDYDFLDPRLEDFYEELTRVVDIEGWIHGYEGLSLQLSWAWHEVAVMEKLFPTLPGMSAYQRRLREITSASNLLLLRVVEELSYAFTDDCPNPWTARKVETQRRRFQRDLRRERDRFVFGNQSILLGSLERATVACAQAAAETA